ncbi:hypothetical protein DYBT9623_04366 [Dyadobacter sp. CECT 9623]|uniref:ABC transporter permease n=1 Tax=Dyadobacter linearis TaxID=2823330 RepID=A0ABM8UVJ2_9BACT|nr:hypothetical protein [Dyadobacter sp. CECT 9623]CAG5072825.1 hypothetical protein DYBT9623_04366 [Dyadobacter sp. CECT 9623]
MNQTFDLHRFVLTVQLEIAEKGRNYLLIASLLLVLLLLLMAPVGLSTEYSNIKELLHILALFMIVLFGSSLYSSFAFSQYASAATGIAAIMVPASATEKFLSSLFLNLIFVVPFALLFYKMHVWTIEYANMQLPASSRKFHTIPEMPLRYSFLFYFIINGAAFLGSLFFQKASYVKTASTLVGLYLVTGIIHISLASYFTDYPAKVVSFPISNWQVWTHGDVSGKGAAMAATYFTVDFPPTIFILIQCFPAVIVLVLWIASFLRLREKEI